MLSVIIPAYNEELSVEKAYYTISGILKEAQIDNEIIFIDDGSTDATYEKIKNLQITCRKTVPLGCLLDEGQ